MRWQAKALFAPTLAALVGLCARTAPATTYISDDFSTYTDGNLEGQNGWYQILAQTTLPIQVTGGKVVVPSAQTANNQDLAKNLGAIVAPPVNMYAGMHFTMESAAVLDENPYTSPSYFFAFYDLTDAFTFANFRVLAKDNSDVVPGTYILESRVTGQSLSPFVAGTIPLYYGQEYNVVLRAEATGTATTNSILYVNPTSADLTTETPYLTASIQTGTPPTSIGSFAISQFASATTGNAGFSIATLNVADTGLEASRWVSGDANFDEIVNGQDIATIAANWLVTGDYKRGDVNGDNIVNGQDIAAIAANWLGTFAGSGGGSAAAVPEPSSVVLAGVGLVAGVLFSRRRGSRRHES